MPTWSARRKTGIATTIEIHELEDGQYVLCLTACGDAVVTSRTLPGLSFRADSAFP